MNTKELKKLIEEKYNWNDLAKLIEEEWDCGDEKRVTAFKEATGLDFEGQFGERVNEVYQFLFKIGDKLYMAHGDYGSYSGVEFSHYEAKSFWQVKPVEKTITVYEAVKEED